MVFPSTPSPQKRINFWRDCAIKSHSNYSMSFPILKLLQRNKPENSEKQIFLKSLWNTKWQQIESWLWNVTARGNLNLKTRKTRSQWWSSGNNYCLLPGHYTLQFGRRIMTIRRNILRPSSGIINTLAPETHTSVLNTRCMKVKTSSLFCPLLRDTL